MINVEDLLKPVSDDKPCGEDFTYHPSFQNLETIARGKPETQFSPAEEPDWKEVRDSSIEVLGQSKHLSAAIILTVSLLELGGLDGLRDGVAVVRGLTEKYWPDVYPKLDPDDNNDPTERLNILNNLSSSGEPLRFLSHLRKLVLCASPSLGRITVQQIIVAKEKAGKPEPEGEEKKEGAGPDIKQIEAAFRDIGPESAAATLALLNDTIEQVQGLENFVDTTLGVGQGANFEALNKLLAEMKNVVAPFAVGDAPAADTTEQGQDAGAGGEGTRARQRGGGQAVSGTIQSREDVVKAMRLICDYYKDNEPSSPVPLILQRAERLVTMDFMAIMSDLTPDAISQLRVITGAKPEE